MAKKDADAPDGSTTFSNYCTNSLAEFMLPDGGVDTTAAGQSLYAKLLVIANANADYIMGTKFPAATEFNSLIALVKATHDLNEDLAVPEEEEAQT